METFFQSLRVADAFRLRLRLLFLQYVRGFALALANAKQFRILGKNHGWIDSDSALLRDGLEHIRGAENQGYCFCIDHSSVPLDYRGGVAAFARIFAPQSWRHADDLRRDTAWHWTKLFAYSL